jgi:hypothetical protein
MKTHALSLALVAATVFATGCRRELTIDEGVVKVGSESPEHYRLRFLDGQLSLNQSCGIKRGNRLNPGVPPARINGRPIGFC